MIEGHGAHATARILARVRAISEGVVCTYGDIDPSAPQRVRHVLATTHEDVPGTRADGSAPKGEKQLALLRREGVPRRGDRVELGRARLPDHASSGVGRAPRPAPFSGDPHRRRGRGAPVMARIVDAIGPIKQRRPRVPDGHFGALCAPSPTSKLADATASVVIFTPACRAGCGRSTA